MANRLLLSLALGTLLVPLCARADSPEAALKKSSPFKDFKLDQVADGQILESRQGASLTPEIEAVQTCFLIKASPDAVAAKILTWNPAGKSGLDVSRHMTLTSSAGPDTFTPALAPLFKSGDSWLAKQSKIAKDPSCELLLTPSEKSQLAAASTPSKLIAAWANLLAARCGNFQDAPDFSHLRATIGTLGLGGVPAPSGNETYYWEIGDVSDRTAISEGVSWSDGSARVFDGEFFVSSEYTASLNVSTLWPVTVKGKPATLVWRIDSAYAPQFTDQSGAERIASAGLILSSAKKTIEALRETGK
jgi:hypothetical protein